MTLIAFRPYGDEFPPDAIYADLDPSLLREWSVIVKAAWKIDARVNSIRSRSTVALSKISLSETKARSRWAITLSRQGCCQKGPNLKPS